MLDNQTGYRGTVDWGMAKFVEIPRAALGRKWRMGRI